MTNALQHSSWNSALAVLSGTEISDQVENAKEAS